MRAHTDAVLCGPEGILAGAKAPTCHEDLPSSVRAALAALEKALEEKFGPEGPARLRAADRVTVGTTLAVNALVQGEAAIGLGMTFQAVQEINKGAELEILYFEEGAPYSTYGVSVVKGKMQRQAVKEVFGFIVDTLILEDKEKFVPEKIYTEQDTSIENYPKDIQYADMTGIDDLNKKEELLSLWQY